MAVHRVSVQREVFALLKGTLKQSNFPRVNRLFSGKSIEYFLYRREEDGTREITVNRHRHDWKDVRCSVRRKKKHLLAIFDYDYLIICSPGEQIEAGQWQKIFERNWLHLDFGSYFDQVRRP